MPLNAESTAAHIAELREQVVPGMFAAFDPGHFPEVKVAALPRMTSRHRAVHRAGLDGHLRRRS